MRERGSASVDPALRVVVRAGGRTRQRRSPAGTRRADRRPAWVCGLSPVTARLVCRERYHGGCDQCSKKDTFRRVLWVERANARMRERGSASVDPALRVVMRAGSRTRQRRSPASTRRADNEQKRVLRRLRVTLQESGRQLFQWLNSFCLPTMLFSC